MAYHSHTNVVGLTTDIFLTVALMEAQDQGNYTCYCTNLLGSAQQTITVTGYLFTQLTKLIDGTQHDDPN